MGSFITPSTGGGNNGSVGGGNATIDTIPNLRTQLDSKATALKADSQTGKIQLLNAQGQVLSELEVMDDQDVQEIIKQFI